MEKWRNGTRRSAICKPLKTGLSLKMRWPKFVVVVSSKEKKYLEMMENTVTHPGNGNAQTRSCWFRSIDPSENPIRLPTFHRVQPPFLEKGSPPATPAYK